MDQYAADGPFRGTTSRVIKRKFAHTHRSSMKCTHCNRIVWEATNKQKYFRHTTGTEAVIIKVEKREQPYTNLGMHCTQLM